MILKSFMESALIKFFVSLVVCEPRKFESDRKSRYGFTRELLIFALKIEIFSILLLPELRGSEEAF